MPTPRPAAEPPAAAVVSVPMPRPRVAPRARTVARLAPVARPLRPPPPDPDASAAPCTDLLASNIAELELTAALSGASGAAMCGDVAPARLTAIRLADGGRVELRPAALLRCDTALVFAQWVREDLTAAARNAGVRIERLDVAASYSCRPRNNIDGAFLSEHGRANAIDIRAIVTADRRSFPIENSPAPAVLLAQLRRSACERFTTVLGPGADAAHADHIHLDLAQRRGGYRLCQWNMPDWPLP